ncbi:MAG: DUF2341 domain-containing protein, partial [Patescibacteria group bacterium]
MVKKYSAKFIATLGIVGLLFLSIIPIFTNIQAALITPLTDTMSNQTVSASSTNSFSFDSISGIPASGTVTVTFPSGFSNVSINNAYISTYGSGPSGDIYEQAVTIDNTGSTLTNYQVQLTLNTQALISAGQMSGNCGDIRFTDSSNNTLYSWLESGCNTTTTIIWVKVPTIASSANTIIYLNYGNLSANFNQYSGEAPNLSSSYGEFDNGSSVFNFYDNFKGTTISPNYTQVSPSGSSIVQNNGITLSTTSSSYGVLIYNTGFTSPFIFEGDVTAVSGVAAGFMLQNGNTAASSGYGFNYWSGSVACGSMSGGFGCGSGPNLQISTGIMGGTWISGNAQEWYKNYVGTSGTLATYTLPNPMYISMGEVYTSPNSSISFQWIRTRQYTSTPPTTTISNTVSNSANIMPGTTFSISGNVVTVTNGASAVPAGTIITISNVIATNPSTASSTSTQYIITIQTSGGDQASIGVVIVASSTYGSGPSGDIYEQAVTIDNTGSTLTNYQVQLTLNTQ